MIPPIAIERFLARVPPAVPAFKGVSARVLHAAIHSQYKTPFRPAKTSPRGAHQLEGVAFALYRQRALLLYDMRLGKSWCALNWAEHLRKAGQWQGKKGLVIVHAPIALDVWESEAAKHSNLRLAIVRTKLSEFIEALESDCDLVVVPWSGLQQIFTEKRAVKVHKLLHKKSTFVRQNKMQPNFEMANIVAEAFSLVIIDEIHKAKNKTTIRFKIALALIKQCTFRLGLTGTPFGRNPFDLWAQGFLIDNGGTFGINYNLFCAAFGKKVKDNRSGKTDIVFDYAKEPLLRQRVDTIALSYERAEIHDVNVLNGQIVLHMEGEQREAYERALDHLIKINDNETAEMLTSFVRLRQISSGYLPFIDNAGNEREITFAHNPKITWLADLFEEDPHVQIIIFHEFIRSGQIICEVLKEAGIKHSWLYGATRNTAEIVRDFTSGKTRVLVANTAKGGMAIDLPTADYVLFFESTTSPTIRQQAEARPMSRGSKVLTVDDMIASAVELKILGFIKEGKDLLQSLVHARKALRSPGLTR